MLDVAAAITTSGVLDWVAIGAVARAEGRQAEAGQHIDLVVDHQLLRQCAW
jgi:phosphatidylglycerophosphate synthase